MGSEEHPKLRVLESHACSPPSLEMSTGYASELSVYIHVFTIQDPSELAGAGESLD